MSTQMKSSKQKNKKNKSKDTEIELTKQTGLVSLEPGEGLSHASLNEPVEFNQSNFVKLKLEKSASQAALETIIDSAFDDADSAGADSASAGSGDHHANRDAQLQAENAALASHMQAGTVVQRAKDSMKVVT